MARASFTVTKNDISPALSKLAAKAKHPEKVLRAGGNVFKSITEGNFSGQGSSYRPSTWAPKKDGSPATLKKSGLLWHSFHLTVTNEKATLANPTPYAAVHQFGSNKKSGHGSGIPPRPFYPVLNGKLTPAAEEKIGAAMKREIEKDVAG
jgi:phage gpG-like protein